MNSSTLRYKTHNKCCEYKTQWGTICMKISSENGWKIVYELNNITVKTNDLCTLKFRLLHKG